MSKGEDKIETLLIQEGLLYKKEVIFSDLNSLKGENLRFDFAIYENKKIRCLIEVDGKQHFIRVPFFHKTCMEFRQAQESDRRKNAYCLRKKIPLIRIPYWAIETLTSQSMFTNPEYLVKNKFHNDELRRRHQ